MDTSGDDSSLHDSCFDELGSIGTFDDDIGNHLDPSIFEITAEFADNANWKGVWEGPLPANDPWSQGHHTRTNKERTGQYMHRRELGFARVKLQNKKLSKEDWQGLLASNDPQAMKVKMEFDQKVAMNNKYISLRRRLKRFPNDPYLLEKLKEVNRSKERFARQKYIKEKKLPLSKPIRDKLDNHLSKLRADINYFNVQGKFPLMKKIHTDRRMRNEMMREGNQSLNPKYAEGDDIANHIIARVEEVRFLIRQAPFNQNVWSSQWQEIDEWMQNNLLDYVPLVVPRRILELQDSALWRAVRSEDGDVTYVKEVSTSSKDQDHHSGATNFESMQTHRRGPGINHEGRFDLNEDFMIQDPN